MPAGATLLALAALLLYFTRARFSRYTTTFYLEEQSTTVSCARMNTDISAATVDPGHADIAAVTVDPVWDDGLELTVSHFLTALPNAIPIVWLTEASAANNLSHANIVDESVSRAMSRGRLRVCALANSNVPAGPPLKLTKSTYNQLRLAPSFWRAMPATWVLFFERDSILCGRDVPPLSHFVSLGYDYLGAPWEASQTNFWCQELADPTECCCNSGLSLVHAPRMGAALGHMRRQPIRGTDAWKARAPPPANSTCREAITTPSASPVISRAPRSPRDRGSLRESCTCVRAPGVALCCVACEWLVCVSMHAARRRGPTTSSSSSRMPATRARGCGCRRGATRSALLSRAHGAACMRRLGCTSRGITTCLPTRRRHRRVG